MHCQSCHADVSSDKTYCPQCGVALSDSNQQRVADLANFIRNEDAADSYENARENVHPWRRLFARLFDVSLVAMILLVALVVALVLMSPELWQRIEAPLTNNLVAALILYLLWIPIEAAFISLFGCTPGKWLFGIRVYLVNGRKLNYGQALKRTAMLWFYGEGLGIPIATIFTRIAAYRKLRDYRTTTWDSEVGSEVLHQVWGVGRTLIAGISVILVFAINIAFQML